MAAASAGLPWLCPLPIAPKSRRLIDKVSSPGLRRPEHDAAGLRHCR